MSRRPGTDWSEWHEAYARPGSGLADRLTAVRARIHQCLDDTAPGPVRVVSACAGDGRDLLGALSARPDADRVTALLVEYDAELAARARRSAEGLPARIEVLEADAAQSDVYRESVPADLVLLCGIFGNVRDADVRTTVEASRQLCAPGAAGDLDPPPPGPRPDAVDPGLVRRRRLRGDRVRRCGGAGLVGRRASSRRRAPAARTRRSLVHLLPLSAVLVRMTSCWVALVIAT